MPCIFFGKTPAPVRSVLEDLDLTWRQGGTCEVGGKPDTLQRAAQCGLIALGEEESGGTRFTERVTSVTMEAVAAVDGFVTDVLPEYKRMVASSIPRIREAYGATGPAREQGISWEEVVHTCIVGWLMDLGVLHSAQNLGFVGKIADWEVLVYPDAPRAGRDCGVRLQHEHPLVVGELWVDGLRRVPALPVNLGPDDVRYLGTLGSRQSLRGPVNDRHRGDIAKLCYFGVIRREGTESVLTIPAFRGDDVACMLTPITQTAARITTILGAFIEDGRCCAPRSRQALAITLLRLLLTRALREQLADGLLPPLPDCALRGWGLWLAVSDRGHDIFHPQRDRQE